MDPNIQSIDKTRRSADILKAELERKSRDLYKVFNPTNQDFQVILNAAISPEVWTIEAKNEAVVPNYVRIKYLEEMSQKIITAKSDKAVIEENDKRVAKGFPKMDLHTEQYRYENKNLKIMMTKREQIVKILDRGLYKEYGIGQTDNQVIDRREKRDDFDPGIDVIGGTATAQIPTVQAAPIQPAPPLTTQTQVETTTATTEAVSTVVEEADEDESVIGEKEELLNDNG